MELTQQVEIWRQKAREGSLGDEEMQEAIKALRAGRLSAAASGKSPTAKAEQEKVIKSITFDDI